MNKRLNFLEKIQDSECDISRFYPFFLSIRHLLSNLNIPLSVAERIINHAEDLGQWKIKKEVLYCMNNADFDSVNVWEYLRVGLENGYDQLIENCVHHISRETDFLLEIKVDEFRNLDILIFPKNISLIKINSDYLDKVFSYFEEYGKIPRGAHKIELWIRTDTDPLFLKEFFKDYVDNICSITFTCFDYLDESFIYNNLSRLNNLNILKICLGRNFSSDCFLVLRNIPALETLVIEESYVENIEISFLKNLKSLKISNLNFSKKIKIKKCPCLERLHISSCPELKDLNISSLEMLQELEFSNCDLLEKFNSDSIDRLSDLRIIKCPNLCLKEKSSWKQ